MDNTPMMRNKFTLFYHETLRYTDEFQRLFDVTEGSPWHRESSVAVHTDMVVAEYLCRSEEYWNKADLLGAFTCAFHDYGKPDAKVTKHSKERGQYFAFHGHEPLSARLWEDWAVRNFDMLVEQFDFNEVDIYLVGWMIQNHLPWAWKNDKRQWLFETLRHYEDDHLNGDYNHLSDVFLRCLLSDTYGRISDDAKTKRANSEQWVLEFKAEYDLSFVPRRVPMPAPVLYVPVGPSGCGKSTFTKEIVADQFSWDTLRALWYDMQDYKRAYELSVKDKKFGEKANKAFLDDLKNDESLVVDNTNLSQKRRKFFIHAARQRGYKIVGVVFPIALQTVIDRQGTRGDKCVPEYAVRDHYMRLAYPSIGEVDDLIIRPVQRK